MLLFRQDTIRRWRCSAASLKDRLCETFGLGVLHLPPGLVDASVYKEGVMDEVEIDIDKF